MLENLIKPIELTFLLGFLLSIVAGVLIGIERESRHKEAGISTHTLVIIGAMVFTFLSQIVDPASKSRIAAQVVTGVGFLGAGLIIKDGVNVKNLTTAASIWFAAAIGMAFGFGYYFIGILATIASIIIPRIPHMHVINKENKDNN
jgi:putative Mg2+ transporter-C (MgtC) family protein